MYTVVVISRLQFHSNNFCVHVTLNVEWGYYLEDVGRKLTEAPAISSRYTCVPSLVVDISKDSPAAAFHLHLGIPAELPDTSFIMHLQQRQTLRNPLPLIASKENLLTV